MSVPPIAPASALLPLEIAGATQDALKAIVQAVAVQEAAVLAELAAPGQDAAPKAAAAPAQPVDAARAAAATRQGGLAPLFADLTEVAAAPALPAPVKAAIAQVLALQLPTEGPVTAETVRQAVSQSGLFLEAHLAAAAAPGAPPPPPDLKGALLALRQALATVPEPQSPPAARQTSPPADAPAPQPARSPTAASPLDPQTIRTALAQAAPALQAHLANTAAAAAPAPDLKSLEATLQRAFEAPGAPPASNPSGPPALSAAALPPAVKAALVQVIVAQLPPGGPFTVEVVRQAVARGAALLEAAMAGALPPEESLAEDARPELQAAVRVLQRAAGPDIPSSTPHAAPPPPPHRNAPPTPQPAARPSLAADAEPSAIARRLSGEVSQAVARQTLHQLASLPEAGGGQAWMFELPVATPQGTAIAQFVVDQDETSGGGAEAKPAWRARFSIDIEPLGPVHVHLRMEGERTAVTVWAERDEALARLRHDGPALARALPADVTFRGGAPPRSAPAPAAGRFLDQTS